MTAGWIAAAVRARGLARAADVYSCVREGRTDLAVLEQEIATELLWRIRVLAAWVPRAGLPLVRAVVARFEMSNIEGHLRRLRGLPGPPAHHLGPLATAWRPIGATGNPAAFHEVLARSPWGDPGSLDTDVVHDAMFLAWLTMLAHAAPDAEVWCARIAALLAARLILVPGSPSGPARTVVRRAEPFLGRVWPQARTVRELADALPLAVRPVLDGVMDPADLWRAETVVRTEIEATGRQLLRTSRPGPPTVLGAFAVMAIGAWRVNATAAAAAGAGSEVLDVAG